MKLFNKEINNRYALWIFLHVLIVIDIILITVEIFYTTLPSNISSSIRIFDSCLCIVLLIEWIYTFFISKPKTVFLKQKTNWIDLVAAIPFDAFLQFAFPQFALLRYLRLLKLLRVFALFSRFFDDFEEFMDKSNLDKVLGGVFFTIIFFTLILSIYGFHKDWFVNFYFVIVTLATVGYGEVHPVNNVDRIITIFLIFAGIFVFSTITAAISSYFTDKLIKEEDDAVEEKFEAILDEKFKNINDELKDIKSELQDRKNENEDLKNEIKELKDLIKKN